MMVFAGGLLFTFGVSGQQRKLDSAGLRETLSSLNESTTQAQQLCAEFSQNHSTPNYFRIQMNSILRDLQISRDQLAAADIDAPLKSAKQEAFELYSKDISTIEQLRDGLFEKDLAKSDIGVFEKVITEIKKEAGSI